MAIRIPCLLIELASQSGTLIVRKARPIGNGGIVSVERRHHVVSSNSDAVFDVGHKNVAIQSDIEGLTQFWISRERRLREVKGEHRRRKNRRNHNLVAQGALQ